MKKNIILVDLKQVINNLNSFTYDFYLNLPSELKQFSVINSSYLVIQLVIIKHL